MGKNKRNRKRGSKKPQTPDQVASQHVASTSAVVQLQKGTFEFGKKPDAEPNGAAAAACPMDTAVPENVAGGAAGGVAEGLSLNFQEENVAKPVEKSDAVGASSFSSHTGGGIGTFESCTAFRPVTSANVNKVRYNNKGAQEKRKEENKAEPKKKRSGSDEAKPSSESRGKRKFEEIEDADETAVPFNQHYVQQSIVAQHDSSLAKNVGEKAESEYYGCPVTSPAQKDQCVNNSMVDHTVVVKPVSMKEHGRNTERDKVVYEAERKEFERKILSNKLSTVSESNYQEYLAGLACNSRTTTRETAKKVNPQLNQETTFGETTSFAEVKMQSLDSIARNENCGSLNITLASCLWVDCQRMNSVKTACEAETRYWEKNQNNSHGKRNAISPLMRENPEVTKQVPKEQKKVRVVKDDSQFDRDNRNLKAVPRKRATKSMSEDGDFQKKDELRKMRATSSMSDMQDDIDDMKLTYAEMVIKGEKDRRARFEVTLAGCLTAEYNNISRLQSALLCETGYQKSLVTQNERTLDDVANKENIAVTENAKKSQRKRQKSRSKSKETEFPKQQELTMKKETVMGIKSKKSVKRSQSHDQECQTEQNTNEGRYAEMVTLPMEEDFTKRLKEEMCQRAAAETMVRMLETETTEQRHMLAEERGKIAKLEALVIHLESEVKEKTLIADEYRARLGETEKQLQEANERIIKLESNMGNSGEFMSSSDYMLLGHGTGHSVTDSLKIKELQDEIQRYKDELEIAGMQAQPGMMSILEHQDILQVVELRAQQAEIKALQLENEILKLKNTKEAWSAASPSHVASSEQRSTTSPHEFSLSAASLFSGLPGLDMQSNMGANLTGGATSTFQLPSFFTSPATSGSAAGYNINPSSELQFGAGFSPYGPAPTSTVGSGQRGGAGDFESLNSESDWSISDDEADSTTPAKSKKSASGSGQVALSDQENLPVADSRQKYSTRNKKPPLPPKPKPKVGPKPGGVKIPSSVQRLGVPLMVMNTNGVSAMHASTIEREEAVSFDQRPQEAKLRVPKRAAGPRGRRRPKQPS